MPALFTLAQWHFHRDNSPVHNSIYVTHNLTKMDIKTVHHPPYSTGLAPSNFCLFPKLRGRRYVTIEEMNESVTKFIDALTQADFHGALQKLLERYSKCITAGGDYFEGDLSFISVLSIKVPVQKKYVNLLNDPRIYIYIYIYIYIIGWVVFCGISTLYYLLMSNPDYTYILDIWLANTLSSISVKHE